MIPAHTRRFQVGLFVAAAVGIWICYYLLSQAVAAGAQFVAQRSAVVTLLALTEAVEKAGGSGEPVRGIVGGFVDPTLASVRVIAFDGISLEASTSESDTGDLSAPRRLSRDEKAIYDRGQRLRAAVETNREEGSARKDEIEIQQLVAGGLELAAPIERDGTVVGMVQIETRPARERVAVVSPRVAVWWWAGAVLLFALLSNLVMRERRPLLAAASALLLVVTIAGYGRQAVHTLETQRRAVESLVAGRVERLADQTTALLTANSLDTAASPSAWDADSFRHPRGLIRSDGTIDETRLAAELAVSAGEVKKAVVAVGLLSLGILAFIGFGAASHIGLTLYRNRISYYYILPAMIGMIVLVFFPFFYGIGLSFTDANIYNTDKSIAETWNGIKNYTDILGDFHIAGRSADGQLLFNYKNFYWTFYITVVWTISNVAIGVTVGLALALILNTKGLAFRPIYRVLLILPWAMPNYIMALIWKGMFHRQFGVINQVMEMLGGTAISWFDRPTTSFLTNLATNGWLSFPFMMVVSLGALQSIPAELYEAAVVDGASRWQQFKAITLPSIKPALIPAIILSVVWTFNMFNIIYLVSAGEPGSSTEILITQAYRFAFQEYRYGYAAAYSTVIFFILIVYGTIQNRVTRATEAI